MRIMREKGLGGGWKRVKKNAPGEGALRGEGDRRGMRGMPADGRREVREVGLVHLKRYGQAK